MEAKREMTAKLGAKKKTAQGVLDTEQSPLADLFTSLFQNRVVFYSAINTTDRRRKSVFCCFSFTILTQF